MNEAEKLALPSTLVLYVTLPELNEKEPPPNCPICKRNRIPVGAEGNDRPTPEEWWYACGSSYELSAETSVPRGWEPAGPCWHSSVRELAALVGKHYGERAGLAEILSKLKDVDADPLFDHLAKSAAPIGSSLPTIYQRETPERCPVCSAPRSLDAGPDPTYACGAVYHVSGEKPDETGKYEPAAWSGGGCSNPPVSVLLSVVERLARRSGEPALADACADARRLLVEHAERSSSSQR